METILSGDALNTKAESLKEIKADSTTWQVFYLDILTNEKWLKEYFHAEMHRGGPPILK